MNDKKVEEVEKVAQVAQVVKGRKNNSFPTFSTLTTFTTFLRGFTLIELLVVISIIGILTSLFLVSYANIQQKARNTQRKNDLKQYQTALENYSSVNNSLYPSKTDGSGASASTGLCPGLSGFMPGCPDDPRKNDDPSYSYLYQSDGSGAGATALKWALWAKLEGETNFWVVCADGRTGEKAQAGFSVSGGGCPL